MTEASSKQCLLDGVHTEASNHNVCKSQELPPKQKHVSHLFKK